MEKGMLKTVGNGMAKYILFIGFAFLLFSCVMPEEFTCDINVKKDGSYSVAAKGTLVYYAVFDEIKKQGKISEKTDSDVAFFFDEAIAETANASSISEEKKGVDR